MNKPLIQEMIDIYQIMIEDTRMLIDQKIPQEKALEKVEESILECLEFFRLFKDAEIKNTSK